MRRGCDQLLCDLICVVLLHHSSNQIVVDHTIFCIIALMLVVLFFPGSAGVASHRNRRFWSVVSKPQTHPWQDLRCFLRLCRKDLLSLFRQFGWASPYYPATKHCWGDKTQAEVTTSGHFPGSNITTRTFSHCTSTTRLAPFHCTICAASYSDVLQPPITFSYVTIIDDPDIQSSCSLLHSAIQKEKTGEGENMWGRQTFFAESVTERKPPSHLQYFGNWFWKEFET